MRARGQHFKAKELVWVHSPQRKKGRCPKLESEWMGPCRVLERLGEVVYRVELLPRGRRVALHRDRFAPYQGRATPPGPGCGTQGTLDTALTLPHVNGIRALSNGSYTTLDPPSTGLLPHYPVPSPDSAPALLLLSPGQTQPQRDHRPPGYLKDLVWPLGGEGL